MENEAFEEFSPATMGVGMILPVVVVGSIGIPIISDLAKVANSTTTATTHVLSYVPLALALALFVAATSMVRTTPSTTDKSDQEETEEPESTEKESNSSKPGVKILGYRISW